MESLGARVVGCGVVMGGRTPPNDVLAAERARSLVSVFDIPMLRAVDEGWDVLD
jgi:hypothetical protein